MTPEKWKPVFGKDHAQGITEWLTSSPRSRPISAKKSPPQSGHVRLRSSKSWQKAPLPPPRGFLAAIERRIAAGDYALIAEIKKGQPVKRPHPGRFRSTFARKGL